MEQNDFIFGKNSVREAVANPLRTEKLFIAKGADDPAYRAIVSIARDNKIPVIQVDRKKIDDISLPFGFEGNKVNHQGLAAQVAPYSYCEVEDILAYAKELNTPPFIIILDGITDSVNFGSIIRSAEVLGAHGIIVSKRRSAPLNSVTCRLACGAAENIRIARVSNLSNAIESLKKNNVWIYAGVSDKSDVRRVDLSGACALVIGSEGDGVSRLVLENCDGTVSIPMLGKTGSLNAAVAAAILMYERQRGIMDNG